MIRRIHRSDTTRKSIVEALRKSGCFVWDIGRPCDLLIYRVRDGRFFTGECKTPRNKAGDPILRKEQKSQADFCSLTNTPYLTSPEQAVAYINGAP